MTLIEYMHENKSELHHHPNLLPNLNQVLSHANLTRPNQHKHQTSFRTSTIAYWKNYTNKFL